jgi:hypothetical protein
MHLLPQLFGEYSYLYLLQLAFMVWMLVDCYRRGAESFWFWIILFFPVIGAWAYFFVIKIHDFRRIEKLTFWPFRSRPSMDELRYRVEQSPTPVNHLAMAERLIEQGDPASAVPHLDAVLAREPDYCSALYSLAICHSQLSRPETAVPYLERINARDRRWSNYRAWYLLIETRHNAGDAGGALETCRQLALLSPTLRHQCMLAERLLDMGEVDEARSIVEKGIDSQVYAPRSVRWRNRPWLRQVRRLQKEIDGTRTRP